MKNENEKKIVSDICVTSEFSWLSFCIFGDGILYVRFLHEWWTVRSLCVN